MSENNEAYQLIRGRRAEVIDISEADVLARAAREYQRKSAAEGKVIGIATAMHRIISDANAQEKNTPAEIAEAAKKLVAERAAAGKPISLFEAVQRIHSERGLPTDTGDEAA